MQSNISKNLRKLFTELGKINKNSKMIIKYGSCVSLAILVLGAFLIVYNRLVVGFDLDLQTIAISLVKNSFVILAEVIIGGLLIDYILGKA